MGKDGEEKMDWDDVYFYLFEISLYFHCNMWPSKAFSEERMGSTVEPIYKEWKLLSQFSAIESERAGSKGAVRLFQ